MCCPAPHKTTRSTARCRTWPIGWPRIWPRAAGRITKSGSTDPRQRRDESWSAADPQRARRRADLRPDLSAAQIQDGHRPAGRQLRRPVCQRPGPDGHRARTAAIVGYNVLVGGGMGVTPSAGKDVSGPGQADGLHSARAGDRRGHGHDQGAARFRQPVRPQSRAVEISDRQLGACPGSRPRSKSTTASRCAEPHPDDVHGFDDHIGWHEQGDGRWFYGLNVENGRIHDDDCCG